GTILLVPFVACHAFGSWRSLQPNKQNCAAGGVSGAIETSCGRARSHHRRRRSHATLEIRCLGNQQGVVHTYDISDLQPTTLDVVEVRGECRRSSCCASRGTPIPMPVAAPKNWAFAWEAVRDPFFERAC